MASIPRSQPSRRLLQAGADEPLQAGHGEPGQTAGAFAPRAGQWRRAGELSDADACVRSVQKKKITIKGNACTKMTKLFLIIFN